MPAGLDAPSPLAAPLPSSSSSADSSASATTDDAVPQSLARLAGWTISGRERRGLGILAFALFGYVLLANSWVNDDAYITFRVIDNVFHGYGLRWNPVERVQVYTHPLWLLLLSAVYAVTRELFYTTLAVSFALGFVTLRVATRTLSQTGQAVVLFALLVSSKAFIDYTSSGLENPLTYVLYAWFAWVYFRREDALGTLTLIGALAFVNRIDSFVPLAPALAYQAWTAWRARGVRGLTPALPGALPAAAWLLFAFVYYGFPFPNTYYAKIATGLPTWMRLTQGVAFLANSLRFDPLTLVVITASVALACTRGATAAVRALALGVTANVAYIVWVGGDYMSGRFLSGTFLLAALLCARSVETSAGVAAMAAALTFYNVLWPNVPLKTTATYEMAWPGQMQNGMKDERGGYHRGTNLLFIAPFADQPEFPFRRDGESLRYHPGRAFERGMVGMVGYYAGPEKYIIDINALGDPLLARLPVDESLYFEFWTSHYFRPVPKGYVESRETGRNRIEDAAIHAYYDRLQRIVSGPIWSSERFADIFRLNFGSDRNFSREVARTRRVDVSARSDSARFSTDVGVRGEDRWLHSNGTAGFLQMGPSIPLREGVYEASWHGVLNDSSRDDVGFVVACYDNCRTELARASIRRSQLPADTEADDTLATLRFRLADDVSDLEYRLFVFDGVKLSLSRIALKTTTVAD